MVYHEVCCLCQGFFCSHSMAVNYKLLISLPCIKFITHGVIIIQQCLLTIGNLEGAY